MRAGEALSRVTTSRFTRAGIRRGACRLLPHMPTLLTASTGGKQGHVQAAAGSNTSRGARKQAPGHLANEKWLTARQSATMRER